MVEGHSVHRVAASHRRRLVGRRFKATSPNGRFAAGAAAIDGKKFTDCQAIGKNLFARFGANDIVHVHFGMAGAWAVFAPGEAVPEPTATTRLRLEEVLEHGAKSGGKPRGFTAHLSAMTVAHGGLALLEAKRAELGEDPLREDAQPERLWGRVSKSSKGIGAIIMDQSFFAGPGNIYRAEILFKAAVHPDTAGRALTRAQFDSVWAHSVALLRRGYECGSILTVDAAEAGIGKTARRRYVYNQARCLRCEARVMSWQIAGRTCYACLTCQPKLKADAHDDAAVATAAAPRKKSKGKKRASSTGVKSETSPSGVPPKRRRRLPSGTLSKNLSVAGGAAALEEEHTPLPQPAKIFNSHCAREPLAARLAQGASKLSVAEIKAELKARELPVSGKRAQLVRRLDAVLADGDGIIVGAEAAAAEKAAAGEGRHVEHIAELAPCQVQAARANVALGRTVGAAPLAVDAAALSSLKAKYKQLNDGKAARGRCANDTQWLTRRVEELQQAQ